MQLSLFINAGPNVSGNLDLFMQQDDTDPFNIGFIPDSGIFDLFSRVPSGSIGSMLLFVDGFFFPSGDINLMILGTPNTINDSANLFVRGFFPSDSGDITFVMNDPIGTIDKSRTLYIRGDGC